MSLTKKILLLLIIVSMVVFLYYQFGWKSYTDPVDKFTIQYPVSFDIVVMEPENRQYSNGIVGWSSPGKKGEPGAKCNGNQRETIDVRFDTAEQYKNWQTLEKTYYANRSNSPINVAGIQTTWSETSELIEVGPINHADKFYYFDYSSPCEKPDGYHFPAHLVQFKQMLANFKFVN